MESNEIKSMIKDLLKPDGYHNFQFEWLIKPKKSNIWECIVKVDKKQFWRCIAKSDKKLFLFKINDNSKIFCKEPLKAYHKIVVNETVVHKDHLKITSKGTKKIQNIKMNAILIGLFVVSPIIGYFIQFPLGLITGFLIGGFSFVIGSSLVTREKFEHAYEK